MKSGAQIARWSCLLPGAVLLVVVALFPIHWAAMLLHSWTSADTFLTVDNKSLFAAVPLETLEGMGNALFVPFVFIYGGASIAPRHKFVTAICLATLILAGVITFLVLLRVNRYLIDTGWFQLIITGFLLVLSIAFGIFNARETNQNA